MRCGNIEKLPGGGGSFLSILRGRPGKGRDPRRCSMRRGNRILTALLLLALVVGLCPGLAFAVQPGGDARLKAQSSKALTPNPASDFTYEVGDYVVVGAKEKPSVEHPSYPSYTSVSDVRSGDPKDYAEGYYTSDKQASNEFSFETRVQGFDYLQGGYACGRGVYITEYKGDGDAIVIPDEIDGLPVVFAGVVIHGSDWTNPRHELDISLCEHLGALYTSAPLRSITFGSNDSLRTFQHAAWEWESKTPEEEGRFYDFNEIDLSGCGALETCGFAGGALGIGRVGYLNLAGLQCLRYDEAYFTIPESVDLRYANIPDGFWPEGDDGTFECGYLLADNVYLAGATMTQTTREKAIKTDEKYREGKPPIRWESSDDTRKPLLDISARSYALGGNGNLTMRFDASHDKLSSVLVDGKTLSKSAYSTRAGSTVVELPEATLASLGAGSHELTALYRDGGISTASFEVTGGSSNPPVSTEPGEQLMYRLYNPNSGEHFYTASVEERDHLDSVGWDYEGHAWTAPKSSNTPVYRLYSGTDHHYTTSAYERDELVKVGWSYEGIGWYSDDSKGIGLHRLFNPNVDPGAPRNNSGSHHYTTSDVERDNLVSIGWRYEEYGWYGVM